MLQVRQLAGIKVGEWATDGPAGPGKGSGVLAFRRGQSGALLAYFRFTRANGGRGAYPIGQLAERGRAGLTLAEARDKAGELATIYLAGHKDIDTYLESRERQEREAAEVAEAERVAKATAEAAQAALEALTVREAWDRYVSERTPRWSALHLRDHRAMAQGGGEDRQRRPEVKTAPGPLAPLMGMRLMDLTPAVVEALANSEAATRPTRLRLAIRLLKAFLRWCGEDPELKTLVDPSAASTRKIRETAGQGQAKNDNLEKGQLAAWFKAVRGISNPTISAYLQILLLTGARREELAGLKWEDVNFLWGSIHLRDKVDEAGRTIPMTYYVGGLLRDLMARNETPPPLPRRLRDTPEEDRPEWKPSPWVFASRTAASGRMVEPSIAHRRACQVAGLEVTLHGLRRSFGTLSEWVELPAGVVYQLMGHKPSATAEKHYRRRPLDLLKVHHQKLEDWILTEAGIDPLASATPAPKLRIVA